MAGEVGIELVLSPRSETTRSGLADAPGWSAYVAEMRAVVEMVIERSGVESLEVDELLVAQPLPDEYSSLRNGVAVDLRRALDLVERMVAGDGPYCGLSAPGQLRIDSGWDGAVHLAVTTEVATELTPIRGEGVSIQWRKVDLNFKDASNLVNVVADEEFWHAVQETLQKTTLLRERWAHGAYGCRWFLLSQENLAEIARMVQSNSLLCVVSEPDLKPNSELLEDDFTAFRAPLLPGELVYRPWPGGADSLSEVVDKGFSLMLADNVIGKWCAVVPDRNGAIRGLWNIPREP